jgi:deoxyribonuclease IV
LKIGCHVSIQGGIEKSSERANLLGCETFQIFTQNQRQWISKSYSQDTANSFRFECEKNRFHPFEILSHASYLINLCSHDPAKLKRSQQALTEELKRCDLLGLKGVVIHPGAHGGNGEEWGVKTIANTINRILETYQPQAAIFLETTAGQGTGIGYKFEHLDDIIQNINHKEQIGICLDTCHIFAAGYPIYNAAGWEMVIEQIEDTFGAERIKAIHLNDSKYPCGGRKDRHAAIGNGFIGKNGFKCLMNMEQFGNIPAILEVPGGDDVFRSNIELLKSMRK